ncbi:MAG: DUF4364 family protein [Candidatus Nanohaloarchaea archaeon]|nr:DUF4364 family protein [Candidatus Nanohaloarchaea archaeon]
MAGKFECNRCERSFDSERGLHVHESKKHGPEESRKAKVVVLEQVKKGKKTVAGLSEYLGMNEKEIKELLDELVDEDYIEEKVEEGKEALYEVTEQGEKEAQALMDDIVEEAQRFVDNVKESFRKHFNKAVPNIKIEWSDEDE